MTYIATKTVVTQSGFEPSPRTLSDCACFCMVELISMGKESVY